MVRLAVVLWAFVATGMLAAQAAVPPQKLKTRPLPPMLRGLTLESMQRSEKETGPERLANDQKLDEICESIARLTVKTPKDKHTWPTVRVVFDLADDRVPNDAAHSANYQNAVRYRHSLQRLRESRCYIMGELLDSIALSRCSPQACRERTQNYLDQLGDLVDLWEIGNEINGEWCGSIEETVQKMTACCELVKARGGRTELTLYYNTPCERPAPNEMFRWVETNRTALQKLQLDYVLLSYYEDNCGDAQPEWAGVFRKLAPLFPKSKIGFGECSMIQKGEDGGWMPGHEEEKARRITHYYDETFHLLRSLPELKGRFVGGYFWWCYRNDMVPWTRPNWLDLNQALIGWK